MQAQYSSNAYYLVRHGEAENNVLNILNSADRGKYHLTKNGRNQIRQTAEFLRSSSADFIVASPVLRAQESAEIIADVLNRPLSFDDRLTEVRFGNFEGKSSASFFEFLQTYGDRTIKRGEQDIEDYNSVRERVHSFLSEVNNAFQGKKIILVSHADSIQQICGELLGADANFAGIDDQWFIEKGSCLIVSAEGIQSFNPAVIN